MAPQLAGQVPVARLGPLVTPLRSVANVCNQEDRPRPHLSVNGPRNCVEIYLLQVQSPLLARHPPPGALPPGPAVNDSAACRARCGPILQSQHPVKSNVLYSVASWLASRTNGPELWRRSYRRLVLPNTADAENAKASGPPGALDPEALP